MSRMDFVISISGCSLGRQSLIGCLREELRENLTERISRRREVLTLYDCFRAALARVPAALVFFRLKLNRIVPL